MSATFQVETLFNTPPVIGQGVEEKNREATRYLYYPLDTIDPARKRQIKPQYRDGGDETESICLLRTDRILPKGRIVPLERAFRWYPLDLMPEGTKPSRDPVPNADAMFGRWSEGLHGFDVWPGDDCANIISRSYNDGGPKGHVEITELLGVPFRTNPNEPGDAEQITALLMPSPRPPKTLREIKQMIEEGSKATGDNTIKRIAEKQWQACEQAAIWAQGRIDVENNLLKIGNRQDWTYTYTPVVELLLEQLELPRQDHALKDLAGLNQQMSQAVIASLENNRPGFDPEMLSQIMQANQVGIATAVAQAVAAAMAPFIEKLEAGKPSGNPNQQNRK